ncbi:MAG TPA: hypothetical protein PKZ56_00635 [Candidatus Paceibacterota bacterium]|nr:hypothetical protein [Candidatus Paceibacterota bacterium]
MKTSTNFNRIKFFLALIIVSISFQACSKDGLGVGTGPTTVGTYALLSGNVNQDRLLVSSKFSENFSGTANAIKVDLDLNGFVDMNKFNTDEYDASCIMMVMKLSNGQIVNCVFPRSLLQSLVHNPYQVFVITQTPNPSRLYSPGIAYLAGL